VNGVKVGSKGALPPAWYDPLWSATWPFARYYRVPAGVLRRDGTDVVAVRVFGGPGRGGIYEASGNPGRVGPFDPALSAGGPATGHVVGGRGWYRRHLAVPDAWRGRRVTLEFEGVYRNAEVFVNGRSVATRPYGYSTFIVDATSEITYGGDNVVAVRVDNDGANSRWYSGSGIFRHVWLHATGPVHVADWGSFVTTPSVEAARASVHVETTVANDGGAAVAARARVLLVGPNGRTAGAAESPAQTVPPGGTAVLVATIDVASPQLWDLDAPRRYSAVTEVLVGRATADRVTTPFGIRTIEMDSKNGLRLNGRPLKLRGACVHHDNGPLGAAAIDRAEERKIELLKANGYNAVRTSHAPPAPAFLDAADRLGVLVMDEAFDVWSKEKNPDDYHRDFDAWGERDLETMVLRDRNHPSVFAWSIGNEIPERAEPEGQEIAVRLAGRARALDPTRPVTAAVNEVKPWANADGAFAPLGIAGYNYLPRFYASDQKRVPTRVIVATESFPLEAFEAWTSAVDAPNVIGDFVWTGMDYLGESGIGHTWAEDEPPAFLPGFPWHVSHCGDLDLCGWKRPQSYYRDVLWQRGAPVSMVVHRPSSSPRKATLWGWPDVEPSWTWPVAEGTPLAVDVYTTAARVDLSLNGAAIGSQAASRATKFTASFTVPWSAGTLRAVGHDEAGAEVGVSELVTAGSGAALSATVDRRTIAASRNDLAYVTLEVLDDRGRRVPDAARPLRLSVTGPAELAAHGNGNPADASTYRGYLRTTFNGRALAILRPTGGPGTIELRAESPGLSPVTVTVVAR
jgi:beta-galactosidase